MKRIIVTAANEGFRELLLGLLNSLRQWDDDLCDAIGILDLGLSEESKKQVERQVDIVITPRWDLPIEPEIRAKKPYLRGMTARPFLREYFPGYDQYLWMDADTWVQDKRAITIFFDAAGREGAAAAFQDHPAYRHTKNNTAWRLNNLIGYYGEFGKRAYDAERYYNTGVLAIGADSELWRLWQYWFMAGVKRNGSYASDQTALNFTIYTEKYPVTSLDAIYNWCCHLGGVLLNRSTGDFHEPIDPFRRLGIIHLTADAKDNSALRFPSKGRHG